MKKFTGYLLSAVFTFCGLWLALIAEVTDDKPVDQGGIALLAAMAFCVSLLFAGIAGSVKCKKDKE